MAEPFSWSEDNLKTEQTDIPQTPPKVWIKMQKKVLVNMSQETVVIWIYGVQSIWIYNLNGVLDLDLKAAYMPEWEKLQSNLF